MLSIINGSLVVDVSLYGRICGLTLAESDLRGVETACNIGVVDQRHQVFIRTAHIIAIRLTKVHVD